MGAEQYHIDHIGDAGEESLKTLSIGRLIEEVEQFSGFITWLAIDVHLYGLCMSDVNYYRCLNPHPHLQDVLQHGHHLTDPPNVLSPAAPQAQLGQVAGNRRIRHLITASR